MLKIEHPDDYQSVEEVVRLQYTSSACRPPSSPPTFQKIEDEADVIMLGLRVYTKGEAPVKIAGQLRHGQLIHWKKKD